MNRIQRERIDTIVREIRLALAGDPKYGKKYGVAVEIDKGAAAKILGYHRDSKATKRILGGLPSRGEGTRTMYFIRDIAQAISEQEVTT
jgi:hypothetical protein